MPGADPGPKALFRRLVEGKDSLSKEQFKKARAERPLFRDRPGIVERCSSASTSTGTAPGSSRNSRNSRDLGPPVREAPVPAAGPDPSRTRAGGSLIGPSALQPPAEAGPMSRPDLTFRRGDSPDRQAAATQPANRDAGRLPAINSPSMSPNVSSSWNGSSRRPSLVHNASSSR